MTRVVKDVNMRGKSSVREENKELEMCRTRGWMKPDPIWEQR